MKTIKYGLRDKKTGKLMGFYTRANPEDCEGVSVTYNLSKNGETAWLVGTPEHAEYVRLNSTEWYNAGYETPENEYDPNELEVVKVEQTIEVNPVEVKIPTIEEYMKLRYLRKDLKHYNPAHYKYCMKALKDSNFKKNSGYSSDIKYNLYDLQELERELAELKNKRYPKGFDYGLSKRGKK
jgi:hypothetical protein